MTDPKRWNETDDDDDDARRLVTTLAKAEPTATMRESVWAKVAATLPTGPGSGGPNDAGSAGGAGGAGAKGGAALGTGAKLLIAAALGAGALSLWVVMRTEAPATPAPPAPSIAMSAPVPPTAPAPPPTEPSTPSASVTAAALAPSVLLRPTSAAPSPVAHASSAPSSSSTATLAADRLREEAEGVKRARQLLRDKNPAGALSELDRLGRLFPSGPLEEEREVLTIEALIGSSGTADLGHRRAERFLAERPQSVHAVRVRGLAGR